MSGESTRDGPGDSDLGGRGELVPDDVLAELAALAQVSPSPPLGPIPDDVPSDVRDFAKTLRVLFGALDMSLNRLAALVHSDPGTVSRYLSGRRIPPPDFIASLCKAVYDAKGTLITPNVQQLVHEQFLIALREHNPVRYKVQRLTDLLEIAAQEKRQYQITVAALEEAIASRNEKIYALELEGRQLRAAWARVEGLLEEEQRRQENLQQTIDSLYAQISYLQEQLGAAQQRASAAEERCQELETRLDAAGALLEEEQEQHTAARQATSDPPVDAGMKARGRPRRSEGPRTQDRTSSARQGLWQFSDNGPATIVCSQLPGHMTQLSNPSGPDYAKLATFADLDALMELHGHIRAENPTMTIRYTTSQQVDADDLVGHVVLLGGGGWSGLPRRILDMIDLPVRQLEDPSIPTGDIFVTQIDEHQENRYSPIWSDENSDTLMEDVGLFVRVPNPYNTLRTLTICNGIHSRGVLGAVRLLTDARMSGSNERYIADHFPDGEGFGILMRVAVIHDVALTPDLMISGTVLYQWPTTLRLNALFLEDVDV